MLICSIQRIGAIITKNKLVQETNVVYIHWVAGMFLSKKGLKNYASR